MVRIRSSGELEREGGEREGGRERGGGGREGERGREKRREKRREEGGRGREREEKERKREKETLQTLPLTQPHHSLGSLLHFLLHPLSFLLLSRPFLVLGQVPTPHGPASLLAGRLRLLLLQLLLYLLKDTGDDLMQKQYQS